MVGFTEGVVETVDGALVVTIGGVLFEPLPNKPPSFFAEGVQEKKVQEWAAANTRHPLFQAEVLPEGRVQTVMFFGSLTMRRPGLPSSEDTRPSSRPHGRYVRRGCCLLLQARQYGLQGSRQEASRQMHLLGLYRARSGSR